MTASRDAAATGARELVLVRVFDAPRETVWKAFTEPARVAAWWGPRGFTTRVEELDPREGGRSRYVMTGPDGKEYPVSGVFLEVDPPSRFVTTDEFDEGFDAQGMDLPEGVVASFELEDLGGRTRLTLRLRHPTPEERRKHEEMGVVEGWGSSFDCLDEYLARAGA